MRAAAWWPGADAGRLAGGAAARTAGGASLRESKSNGIHKTHQFSFPQRAQRQALCNGAARWPMGTVSALLRCPVALLRAPLGSGDWQRGQRGGHSHFPFLSTTRLSCHLAAGGRKGRGGGRGDVERRVAPYGLLAVDDARRLAGVAAARSEPARFQIQRDQKTFVSVRRGASGRAGRVGQAGRRIGRGGWWDTWLQQ